MFNTKFLFVIKSSSSETENVNWPCSSLCLFLSRRLHLSLPFLFQLFNSCTVAPLCISFAALAPLLIIRQKYATERDHLKIYSVYLSRLFSRRRLLPPKRLDYLIHFHYPFPPFDFREATPLCSVRFIVKERRRSTGCLLRSARALNDCGAICNIDSPTSSRARSDASWPALPLYIVYLNYGLN